MPGRLSQRGRMHARQLGQRRTSDGITAVFSSDLTRAVETASAAFGESTIPVLYDWRLRECDYGQGNGMPVAELHAGRREHLDRPYPGGESWQQAVARAGRFLAGRDTCMWKSMMSAPTDPASARTRPVLPASQRKAAQTMKRCR